MDATRGGWERVNEGKRERRGEEKGSIVKYLHVPFGVGILIRLLRVSSIVRGVPRRVPSVSESTHRVPLIIDALKTPFSITSRWIHDS